MFGPTIKAIMRCLIICFLLRFRIAHWLLGVWFTACHSGSADTSTLRVTGATSLRQIPEENGAIIRPLRIGEALSDVGEVSPYLSGIYSGSLLLWEPWLRVRTSGGQTGWVFGGLVKPDWRTEEEMLRWRYAKRLQAFLGAAHAQHLIRWSTQAVSSDSALAEHLRTGLALRDMLQTALRYGLRRPTPEAQPDLRWLEEYLRYFRRYRGGIALDYSALAHEAQQTKGQQDDYFARLSLQLYPIDSMESPLPAWVFPMNWTESASNLGAGHHWATLRSLDQAFRQAPLFEAECERLKNLVLVDILDNERSYWQPLSKVLAELDQIRAHPPSCLTQQERTALDLRRQMLARGMARTDLRSGR